MDNYNNGNNYGGGNNNNRNNGGGNNNNNKKPKNTSLIVFIIIAAVITFIGITMLNNLVKNATYKEITYNEFIEMVNNDEVKSVALEQDRILITPVDSAAATIKVPRAEHYYAAYDTGTGTVTENILSSEFTSTQNVSADMARPMVASSVTPALSFKNLLGSLRLNISGDNGTKITKIVLTATSGSNLTGKFSVDLAYEDTPMIEWTSEASSTLTVDLGSQGIELKEAGTPVDVLLPAASYGGFAVTIYDTKNGVMLNEKLPAIDIPSGETVSTDVTYEPGTEQVVYLKAKVEKAADGSDFIWNSGSSIYVNGEPIILYRGEGTADGEFGPCLQADSYYASTSNASIDGISGTQMRVNIPAKQEYGASLTTLNPAAATSTSTDLNFRYVAGVVKLTVSGPHAVRTIELQGKNNRRLAGDGMINMTASDFALSLNADASKSITVNCGKSGVSIESGHDFSFVLPAGDYSEG